MMKPPTTRAAAARPRPAAAAAAAPKLLAKIPPKVPDHDLQAIPDESTPKPSQFPSPDLDIALDPDLVQFAPKSQIPEFKLLDPETAAADSADDSVLTSLTEMIVSTGALAEGIGSSEDLQVLASRKLGVEREEVGEILDLSVYMPKKHRVGELLSLLVFLVAVTNVLLVSLLFRGREEEPYYPGLKPT